MRYTGSMQDSPTPQPTASEAPLTYVYDMPCTYTVGASTLSYTPGHLRISQADSFELWDMKTMQPVLLCPLSQIERVRAGGDVLMVWPRAGARITISTDVNARANSIKFMSAALSLAAGKTVGGIVGGAADTASTGAVIVGAGAASKELRQRYDAAEQTITGPMLAYLQTRGVATVTTDRRKLEAITGAVIVGIFLVILAVVVVQVLAESQN